METTVLVLLWGLLLSLLGGGSGPTPTPTPPPTPAPTPTDERWAAWIERQPGVELLDPETFLTLEEAAHHVVRADDEASARAFLGALEEAAPAETPMRQSLVVHLVLGDDDARSALRFVPHHTSPEAISALVEPLPSTAHLRLIGHHEEVVTDPHHQGPQPFESAPDVRYFATDLAAAAREATAPSGFAVSVVEREYGTRGPESGAMLGVPVNAYADPTDQAELRRWAEALALARELPAPPGGVLGYTLGFADRTAALEAAKALPDDFPLAITTQPGQHTFHLHPEREWPVESPSRAELIGWIDAHPEARMSTIGGVDLTFDDVAPCEAFLDAPPAWTGVVQLACPTVEGGKILVRDSLDRLPALHAQLLPVAGGDGRVSWYEEAHRAFIHEGDDLDAQIRAARALGWEGEFRIDLTGKPGQGERRGASIEFLSTATGEATEPKGAVAGERAELLERWNATATS